VPTEASYSLQDLADLADVSPRTVRYYVAQGLLPSPGQVGPAARYSEGHLDRLRLIRRLQREHLPLAEIRVRLAELDDETVAELVDAAPLGPPESSALAYIRSVLAPPIQPEVARLQASLSRQMSAGPPVEPDRTAEAAAPYVVGRITLPGGAPLATPAKPTASEPVAQRSQWDRIALSPDIELNIRRPLSRQQNKQVERLIAIARELLEEDQP